jgi:hypothetical protein
MNISILKLKVKRKGYPVSLSFLGRVGFRNSRRGRKGWVSGKWSKPRFGEEGTAAEE